MKLANEIAELLEASLAVKPFDPNAQAEAGDTDTVEAHWHKTEIDVSGNGRTLQTLATGYPEHTHKIVAWEAQPAEDGHTHKVIA